MIISEIELLLGIIIIILFSIGAYISHSLDKKGLASSIIIGIFIFLGFLWKGLIIIICFFIISTISTKIKYSYKRKIGFGQEKGGARGWKNTFANGGLPALISIIYIFTNNNLLIIAFIGSVATITADTLATEIGLLSKKRPRLIINLSKKVGAGTSGGISILGEIMVLLGSLLIGLITLMLEFSHEPYYRIILISNIGGFVGANFDSIIGATYQGKNKCTICGAITESGIHHSKPTTTIKGIKYIGNNFVNFISSIGGASIAVFFEIII